MTDEPISLLGAATLPLGGSDKFEVLQAGANKQVGYSDMLGPVGAYGTPGNTVFVDNANGDDTRSGLTWSLAKKTIAAALTAVEAMGGGGNFRGDVFLSAGAHPTASQLVLPESVSLHGNMRASNFGFEALYDNGSWIAWTGANPGSAGLTTGSVLKTSAFARGGVIENVGISIPGTMTNLRAVDMVDWQNMSAIRDVLVKGDHYAAAFCAYNKSSLGATGFIMMERLWHAGGAARPFWFNGGVENVLMQMCGSDDANGGATTRVQAVVTIGATGVSDEVYPGGASLGLTMVSCKNEMGGTTTGDFPFVRVDAGGSGYDAQINMFGCLEQSNFSTAGGLTTPCVSYLATPSQPDDKLPVCVKGMTSQSRAHLVAAPNASPPITFDPTTPPSAGHRTRWNSPESWMAP